MYIIVWEYQVKKEKQFKFEEVYSPIGVWAKLFKKSNGYVGIELLRDNANPQRYLTLDKWKSKEEYEIFLSKWELDYKTLDERCDELTLNETLIGEWNTINT